MRAVSPLMGLLLLAGCDSGGEIREWQVSDHPSASQGPAATGTRPQVPAAADPGLPAGLTEVTLVTWRRNCANCHGMLGRGDGPQGQMVKARDLTDLSWQASVSDAQIAEVISKGRGAMPPSNLPDATVSGLVRLVRVLGEGSKGTAPAGSAREAPASAPASSR